MAAAEPARAAMVGRSNSAMVRFPFRDRAKSRSGEPLPVEYGRRTWRIQGLRRADLTQSVTVYKAVSAASLRRCHALAADDSLC